MIEMKAAGRSCFECQVMYFIYHLSIVLYKDASIGCYLAVEG